MGVESEFTAVSIGKTVRQTAHLGAFAPVGTAPRSKQARLAVSTVTHAQRAVDENLDRHSHCGNDSSYFFKRQLSRKHDLGKATILEKPCLLRCSGVTLGASMQRDRRNVHSQDRKILNNQSVDPYVIKPPDQLLGSQKLVIIDQSVECDIYPSIIGMGKLDQFRQIINRITCRGTRPERFGSDIHRVGTM